MEEFDLPVIEEPAREKRMEQTLCRLYDSIVGKCTRKNCENGFIRSKAPLTLEGMVHSTSQKCDCFKIYDICKSYTVSGIPREFWGMKDFDISNMNIAKETYDRIVLYIQKLEGVFEHGINLVFDNPAGIDRPNNGVGKTAIAMKVLQNAHFIRRSTHYITMHSYFNLVYRSKEDKTYLPLIDEIEEIDCLCVDEVGKINETPYVRNKFEDMIRTRSNRFLITIIVSNMNQEELRAMLGSSIMDILSNSITISLVGSSYRQQRFVDIQKKLNWGIG